MTKQSLSEQLEAAVYDLQARVSFQDATIEALNRTIAQQASELATLKQELQRLGELLRELSPGVGSEAAHEPPPHY